MPVRTSKEYEERKASQLKTGAPAAAPSAKKPKAPPVQSALEPAKAPEPKPFKKKSQKWTEPFIMAHPDSTPDSPIDVTILLNGEKIKVVDGLATVRDEGQHKALIKAGWRWINEKVVIQVDPRWEAELKRFKENQNG
jgi:hypothetical protein